MKYYKHLYAADDLKRKKAKVLRRLEQGKWYPGVFLLLLPSGRENQLEIVNSLYLIQPDYPKTDRFLVGIARNYEDALELVEKISAEVYDETGDLDIRGYLMTKEQED